MQLKYAFSVPLTGRAASGGDDASTGGPCWPTRASGCSAGAGYAFRRTAAGGSSWHDCCAPAAPAGNNDSAPAAAAPGNNDYTSRSTIAPAVERDRVPTAAAADPGDDPGEGSLVADLLWVGAGEPVPDRNSIRERKPRPWDGQRQHAGHRSDVRAREKRLLSAAVLPGGGARLGDDCFHELTSKSCDAAALPWHEPDRNYSSSRCAAFRLSRMAAAVRHQSSAPLPLLQEADGVRVLLLLQAARRDVGPPVEHFSGDDHEPVRVLRHALPDPRQPEESGVGSAWLELPARDVLRVPVRPLQQDRVSRERSRHRGEGGGDPEDLGRVFAGLGGGRRGSVRGGVRGGAAPAVQRAPHRHGTVPKRRVLHEERHRTKRQLDSERVHMKN
mmetsp:Transcript_25433/g.64061  ORF Transcript_25433/g.64061 Transcript_25433/m.64061 type:complete len:387 (+) Transcript_25433:696-1856(+)